MANNKYSGVYNSQHKEQFCVDAGYSVDSAVNAMRIFKASATSEEFLGKDLYDFNREELKKFFFNLKPRTTGGSKQNVGWVINYINWAIEHKIKKGINPLASVEKEWKEQFANSDAKFLWTDKEIDEIIGWIKNVQDQTIVSLLFAGIKGEDNAEITNLQIKDVHELDGTLTLTDKDGSVRTKEVTPRLIALCLESSLINEYDKANGDPDPNTRSLTMHLVLSEFIIKVGNTNSKGINPKQNVVFRRLAVIVDKELDGEPNFNPTQIMLSGLLAQAKDIYLEKGSFSDGDALEMLALNHVKPTAATISILNEQTIKKIYSIK